MDNENEKRVYCTNMNEKDPIIEKFMKEYLKEKEANTFRGGNDDDIIVNFDIARKTLEKIYGRTIEVWEAHIEVQKILRDFILQGGYDLES